MKFFVGVTDKNCFYSLEIGATLLAGNEKELYKLLNIITDKPILVLNR